MVAEYDFCFPLIRSDAALHDEKAGVKKRGHATENMHINTENNLHSRQFPFPFFSRQLFCYAT